MARARLATKAAFLSTSDEPCAGSRNLYCAACAFVAAMSASLRNDITETFRVR